MTVTIANLAYVIGEHWPLRFQATDDDGAALPIVSARWRVAGDDALVLDVDATITNGGAGFGEVVVPPVQTRAIAAGVYRHELQAVAVDGRVTTQAVGSLDAQRSLFVQFP